jgi:adenosine deaminase
MVAEKYLLCNVTKDTDDVKDAANRLLAAAAVDPNK